MDRLGLGFDRGDLQREVAAAYQRSGVSGVRAAREVFRGSAKVQDRVAAVAGLTPEDQFRILHGDLVASDAEGPLLRQQVNTLRNSARSGKHIADLYARAAGYVPPAGGSALAQLPVRSDRETLVRDTHVITDAVSKEGVADTRAEDIADGLLDRARGVRRVHAARGTDLRRALFNTRLMLALRGRGYGVESLSHILTNGGGPQSQRNTVKLANRLLAYPQETSMRDVDTVSDVLSLLRPEDGQELAAEFFETYQDRNTMKRSIWKITEPHAIRREAVRQGPMRSGRATVEMLLRAMGLRDADDLDERAHEQVLDDLLRDLGLTPGDPLADREPDVRGIDSDRVMEGLADARDEFKALLYLDEARKRGPK